MPRFRTLVAPAVWAALFLALALLVPQGMGLAQGGRVVPAGSRGPDRAEALPGAAARAGPHQAVEPTPLPEAYGLVATWDTVIPTGRHLFHPTGIAVDAHGTVVLAEAGNHRLTRASSRGAAPMSLQPNEPPQRIGGPGAEAGRFTAPEDVAVSTNGDRIYVADTGNRRVQVLAPSGAVLAVWTAVGLPRGIAVGPAPGPDGAPLADGRVYVADAEGRRVRVFDAAGTWLADWDAGGALVLPLGLSISPDGDLVVADHGAQRVLWLDADGSEGQAGAELGSLRLDNGAGPGGAPLDVGVNDDGEVFVAVARGVLRYRPSTPASIGEPPPGAGLARDLAFAAELPPLRSVPCTGECRPLAPPCDLVHSEPANHEGIQRLDLRPGVGLYITYAPSLRWGDRVVVYPALKPQGSISRPEYNNVGLNWAWPRPCRDYSTAEFRHATDPDRLDTGRGDPFYAIGLDSAGWLRQWRANGSWHDGLHETRALRARDLAVERRVPIPRVAVITGNQVYVFGPLCLLQNTQNPFPPGTCRLPAVNVLDRNQLIRRERTGDCRRAEALPWRPGQAGPCIPDDTFWHTAISFGSGPAVLDSGNRRLIVRSGQSLVAGPLLDPATAPFRSFMDLDYDRRDQLWVLAREGALRVFDERGRDRGEMALLGPAAGRAEALALDPDGGIFVLTGDGWIWKYAAETAPPPTASPSPPVTPGPSPRPTRTLSRPTATPLPTLAARALPVAGWRIDEAAGPGRYRDVAVGADGRVLVPDGANDRVLVFAPVSPSPGATPTAGTEPPGCNFLPAKVAQPARLPLGETTTVSLDLGGDCGRRHQTLDLVVVVDASCQMAGERLARAREALVALVDAMTLPGDRMAIVTFLEGRGDARVLVPLTADRERLREAGRNFRTDCHIIDLCLELDFRRVGYLRSFLYPSGCLTEGRISDGLRAGRETLFGPAARPESGKALILVSPSRSDSQHTLATLSLDPETFDPPFSPAEMARWKNDLSLAWSLRVPVADREHAMWEAWQLREAGVRVLTTGVGVDSFGAGHPPDQGLLAAAAWPADGYRPAGSPAELVEVLAANGRELSARLLMHSLVITDRIPANMRLLPGSVQPAAEILPEGGRPEALLRWTLGPVPLAGVPQLSYRLEPLAGGLWPTNVEAFGDYVDGFGRAGRSIFPVPYVEVIAPTPTEEATPVAPPTVPSATPTPSATPSPTPGPPPTGEASPSATPSPSPIPTRTRRPPPLKLYLPYLEAWRCQPSPRPVDVALVVDTSSSMAGEKLAAAQRAAGTFANLLDLRPGQDRAAVIGFDSGARLAQTLTPSRGAVQSALASLAPGAGTRIDRGLAAAADELLGPRHRGGADLAIVLLTDGLPQAGTEAQALAEADRARSAAIATWVIGLGADVQPAFLARLAGGPERLRLAPAAGDLEAIYRQIASGLVCR